MYPTLSGISCCTFHVKRDTDIALCRQTSANPCYCNSVSLLRLSFSWAGCLSVITASGFDPKGGIQNRILPHFPVRSFFQQSNFAYCSLLLVPLGSLSWPGIILLLSSKPDLSSARFHLGFSVLLFSLVLTPGRESCQCAWLLHGLCRFQCV